MSASTTRAPLLPIAFISAAALAYELLLTRIFAIVHWHHLVATAISLALLGYGVSGTFLTLSGGWLRRHFAAAFVLNAGLFSLATVTCVWIAQRIPFDPQALLWDVRQAAWLLVMLSVLALPFFAAANCIGLALARFRDEIPRIYGVDMLGAGLGAILLTLGVMILHPADALLGLLLAGLAVTSLAAHRLRWHARPVLIGALVTATLAGLGGAARIEPAPYKDLSRALSAMGASIDQHRNGIGGVIDVVSNDTAPSRVAPGLSLHSMAAMPRQLAVFIDGDASGAIIEQTAGSADMLREMLSALPYHLLDSPRVAIINAALDHRVRQAVLFGARDITALARDTELLSLYCGDFAQINHDICHHPGVTWQAKTARALTLEADERFDLISLTSSADPGGLDALDIDYALTQEAIRGYLQHLTPRGVLAIEAPTRTPPALSVRLLSTARSALQAEGHPVAANHLAMVRGWQRFIVLVTPQTLDASRRARIRTFADSLGFDLVWLPDIHRDETNRFQRLREPAYFAAATRVLAPAVPAGGPLNRESRTITDDRPFPHRISLWRSLLTALQSGDMTALRQADNALVIAAFTLVFAVFSSILLILLPLYALRRDAGERTSTSTRLRVFAYFGLLGPAFLFTEIAWIQRLELFLHQPLYAAAIALTAFLLFAGLGSLMVQRVAQRSTPRLLVFAVALIGLYALAFALGEPALQAAAAWPYAARLALATLLLAPLALAMGVPFSAGLRSFGDLSPRLIPWAWGINGCGSVISAAGAAVLAPEIGFTGLIASAALAYVLLPFLFPHRHRPEPAAG